MRRQSENEGNETTSIKSDHKTIPIAENTQKPLLRKMRQRPKATPPIEDIIQKGFGLNTTGTFEANPDNHRTRKLLPSKTENKRAEFRSAVFIF